jgi:hypothetical protein
MVAVFPDKLSFYRGLAPTQQRLSVTVEGEHVILTVAPPAPGSEFRWTPSPAAGWTLGSRSGSASSGGGTTSSAVPIPMPRVVIPVDFWPNSQAPVHGKLSIMATKDDIAKTPIPAFPVDVQLDGNVDGVGPGTLQITRINFNPTGPDLMPTPPEEPEFVEIVNVSSGKLDLKGCRLGDFMRRGGRRELYRVPGSLELEPISGMAEPKILRVYTGKGDPSDASIVRVSLNRAAPVWNNVGDTAWIDNPSELPIHSFTYPFPTAPLPELTPQIFAAENVSLPHNATFVSTSITAEEGDRLVFYAWGSIHINAFDTSEPNGRGDEPAPAGWPADAPPFSLIGRFGAAGNPFLVGYALNLTIKDDANQGPLFLGLNDPSPSDNWYGSYSCNVIQWRPS